MFLFDLVALPTFSGTDFTSFEAFSDTFHSGQIRSPLSLRIVVRDFVLVSFTYTVDFSFFIGTTQEESTINCGGFVDPNYFLFCPSCYYLTRLRVVSNFGDGDCGVGEIHTRARAKFRGDATRRERRKCSLRVASLRNFVRACVYFARPTIAIAKIRDYSQSTTLQSTRDIFMYSSLESLTGEKLRGDVYNTLLFDFAT